MKILANIQRNQSKSTISNKNSVSGSRTEKSKNNNKHIEIQKALKERAIQQAAMRRMQKEEESRDFHKTQELFVKNKEKNISKMREQQFRQVQKECSFTPQHVKSKLAKEKEIAKKSIKDEYDAVLNANNLRWCHKKRRIMPGVVVRTGDTP